MGRLSQMTGEPTPWFRLRVLLYFTSKLSQILVSKLLCLHITVKSKYAPLLPNDIVPLYNIDYIVIININKYLLLLFTKIIKIYQGALLILANPNLLG